MNCCKEYKNLYRIEKEEASNLLIEEQGFSGRLKAILLKNHYVKISDLLEESDESLSQLYGFGEKCIKELNLYFRSFEKFNVEDIVDLARLYSLTNEEVTGLLVQQQGFSKGLENRLLENGILTIGDLLKKNKKDLNRVLGLTFEDLKELDFYFIEINKKGDKKDIPFKNKREINRQLVLKNLKAVESNDYSFLNSPKEDHLQFNKSLELLGPELIHEAIFNSKYTFLIYQTFEEYNIQIELEREYQKCINELPKKILNEKARIVFELFNKCHKRSSFPESLLDIDSEVSLKEFLTENKESLSKENKALSNLINWLKTDLLREYKLFRTRFIEKSSYENVLKLRSSGLTLEQTGRYLNLTRQRVSQIENKIQNQFKIWSLKNLFFELLFLLYGNSNLIRKNKLSSIFHEYTEEIEYFIKKSRLSPIKLNGETFYYFNKFNIDSILKNIYSNSLDIIHISEVENFISETITEVNESSDLSNDTVRILVQGFLKENYHIGKNYLYKKKLSKKRIVEKVLLTSFPEGIQIYKEEELDSLKRIAVDEFGLDLFSNSLHAIQALILNNENCYLCNRGTYIHKSFLNELTEDLYLKIEDYIECNARPMILSDTLFSVFEEELKAQNVNNKYKLLSLIKIKFGNRWFYRRDCISKNAENLSIYEGILEFIKSSPRPVKKEDLRKEFPGVTEIVLCFALNNPDILNLYGSYLHVNYLKISKEDSEWLQSLVSHLLEGKELVSTRLIYDYINRDHPYLLKRNYINTKAASFDFIKYVCGEKYYYYKPYISKIPIEFSNSSEPIIQIVKQYTRVDIEDVIFICREEQYQLNNVLNLLNSCNDTHFILNSREIGEIELTGINRDIVTTVEDLIYEELHEEDRTLPINRLSCIHFLPKIRIPWSDWLIYSVLYKFSDKLEVAASDLHFRSSVPLVSLKNRMNIGEFSNVDLEPLDSIEIYSEEQELEDILADLVDELDWEDEIEF